MEHTEPYEKVKFTAVEWLYLQLIKNPKTPWNDILEQAKEMEKQQIMEAVYDSIGTNFDPNMGRAEQYYNTTVYKTLKDNE
jgi:hypothetical protein